MSAWYFVIVAILAGLFWFFWYRPKKLPKYPFKLANLSDDEQDFLNLWNLKRWRDDRPTIYPDSFGSDIALDHNLNMLARGKAFHSDPEETFAQLVVLGATYMDEIVDSGYSTVETAFTAFVNSPKHLKVLMHPKINAAGLSVEKNANGKYSVVVIVFKVSP